MDASAGAADSCQIDVGDVTWVMVASVLVLGMMPGLAFFEAGLLRRQNTMSIIMQVMSGLPVLSVLWYLFGFSLTFGTDHGGVIGDFRHGLFIGIDFNTCWRSYRIPQAAYAIFQLMFAAITPLLMTGAYAERMRFKASFMYTILWEIFIYYPLAHWIWGGGWLDTMGVEDFAGGIVIHTSAGTGAIVCALVLGRRPGFEKTHGEWPPSNFPLATVGAALLLTGWVGFNAGSALEAGSLAVQTVLNTQVGGSMSGVVWLILSWVHNRKPSVLDCMNGVIGGLAGITPASGYISTPSALLVGMILGFVGFYGVRLLKHRWHIDDALDVSSVHGLTGLVGALAIGFCGDSSVNPAGANGLIYGEGRLLGVQVLAIVVAIVYPGVLTWVILKVVDATVGLRHRVEKEGRGLDFNDHREMAYQLFLEKSSEGEEHDRVWAVFPRSETGGFSIGEDVEQHGMGPRKDSDMLQLPAEMPPSLLQPGKQNSSFSTILAAKETEAMHLPSSPSEGAQGGAQTTRQINVVPLTSFSRGHSLFVATTDRHQQQDPLSPPARLAQPIRRANSVTQGTRDLQAPLLNRDF